MLFQNSGQRSHTSIPAIEKTHVPILPRPIFRSITLFSWTSSPVRGSSSRFFLLHVKRIVSDWNDDLHCADQDFVVGCGQTGKREEGFRTSRRPPIQVHRSRSRP